jgi:hypothetical protein
MKKVSGDDKAQEDLAAGTLGPVAGGELSQEEISMADDLGLMDSVKFMANHLDQLAEKHRQQLAANFSKSNDPRDLVALNAFTEVAKVIGNENRDLKASGKMFLLSRVKLVMDGKSHPISAALAKFQDTDSENDLPVVNSKGGKEVAIAYRDLLIAFSNDLKVCNKGLVGKALEQIKLFEVLQQQIETLTQRVDNFKETKITALEAVGAEKTLKDAEREAKLPEIINGLKGKAADLKGSKVFMGSFAEHGAELVAALDNFHKADPGSKDEAKCAKDIVASLTKFEKLIAKLKDPEVASAVSFLKDVKNVVSTDFTNTKYKAAGKQFLPQLKAMAPSEPMRNAPGHGGK